MDVIIVGGGIGGLTLALAVHASGAAKRIRIFEGGARDQAARHRHQPSGRTPSRSSARSGMQDALTRHACLPQDYQLFTRHGQLVYREPWGMAAGHQWPHRPIYRADLHGVLPCGRERLGPAAIILDHKCVGAEQDDAGVTARFIDADGAPREVRPRRRGDRLRRHPSGGAGAVYRTKARSFIVAPTCGAA